MTVKRKQEAELEVLRTTSAVVTMLRKIEAAAKIGRGVFTEVLETPCVAEHGMQEEALLLQHLNADLYTLIGRCRPLVGRFESIHKRVLEGNTNERTIKSKSVGTHKSKNKPERPDGSVAGEEPHARDGKDEKSKSASSSNSTRRGRVA